MKIFRHQSLLKAIVICCAMSAAVQTHADWLKQEQAIMGTAVSVELWHEERQQGQGCIDKVMAEMHRIDHSMSPFKPQSALSKINRLAATQDVPIDAELYELIKRANEISKLTDGRFDITFASVGLMYDYRKGLKPKAKQLQDAVKAINYRHIKLTESNHSIRFSHPGVKIDLGGIAKGYAVDRSIALLQACGIQHALVSAGGDSRILGDKRGKAWMTGIRHPRQKNRFAVVIPLTNTAISTSGDYERYFIEDGVRYHHIINPSSGQAATTARSVTVLGPEATTTDALSTAFFVMGPAKALALAETLAGIEAIIIDTNGIAHYTTGLMPPKSAH